MKQKERIIYWVIIMSLLLLCSVVYGILNSKITVSNETIAEKNSSIDVNTPYSVKPSDAHGIYKDGNLVMTPNDNLNTNAYQNPTCIRCFYSDKQQMLPVSADSFKATTPLRLHQLNPVFLLTSSNTHSPDSFSAAGPVATLNPYAINQLQSESLIIGTIIEPVGDFYTKVSFEGVIPTSSIAKSDEDIKVSTHLKGSLMYILNDCSGFLTPSEDSGKSYEYSKGSLVKATRSYEDWYYVENQFSWDSSTYPSSWLKKEHLGYYDAFDSNIGLMVEIKEDSLWIDGSPVQEYTTFGVILSETEDYYELLCSGGFVGKISKDNVKGFSIER